MQRRAATGLWLATVALTACQGSVHPDGGDGGIAVEGAHEATPSAGASPGSSPCTEAHLFCADFDDGPLERGWSKVYSGSSVGRLDRGVYVSPGASFLATTPSFGAGSTAYFDLSQFYQQSYSEMHLAFDVRPERLDDERPWIIADIETTGDAVILDATSREARLVDSGWGDLSVSLGTLPLGRFSHVEIDFVSDAVTVRFDGEVRVSAWPVRWVKGHETRFDVGLVSPRGAMPTPASIRFDDVVFDAR